MRVREVQALAQDNAAMNWWSQDLNLGHSDFITANPLLSPLPNPTYFSGCPTNLPFLRSCNRHSGYLTVLALIIGFMCNHRDCISWRCDLLCSLRHKHQDHLSYDFCSFSNPWTAPRAQQASWMRKWQLRDTEGRFVENIQHSQISIQVSSVVKPTYSIGVKSKGEGWDWNMSSPELPTEEAQRSSPSPSFLRGSSHRVGRKRQNWGKEKKPWERKPLHQQKIKYLPPSQIRSVRYLLKENYDFYLLNLFY